MPGVLGAAVVALAAVAAGPAAGSAQGATARDGSTAHRASSLTGVHQVAARPRGGAGANNPIPGPLLNNGGPVQSAPKVYIDYWGWSGDASGEQPYLNRFISSVGGTSWLATVNQYGGGSQAGLLGGTWSDPNPVPAAPSDAQIQAEAASAASHFGTGTSVNVEIVVATPSGHSTPGFGSQWCAYHGKVGSLPNVTYTDLPYMSDAGANCGENIVNAGAAGVLDGVSIVEGHELAETVTDPLLNAWIDAGGNEIGDKCAWYQLANVNLNGNTFAMQPLWSNAANGCVMATGGGGGGGNLLTSPSFEGSAAEWQRFVPSGGVTNMVDYNTAAGAPATAHDGTWYLAFNTNGSGGSVYQDVTVNAQAGSSYLATAWLASQSGTASGVFCAWGLGSTNTNTCRSYSVGTGYTRVQVAFSATQAVSAIRFQVYPTPNGGTTDMDTTSLYADMLKAASFEQNTTGWQRIVPSGGVTNMVDYNTAAGAPAPAQDGTGYLAFNTNGSGGSVYQDIPVNAPAGSTFTASAWIGSQSGTATGTLALWGLGASNTNAAVNYSVSTTAYGYVTVTYTAPQAISTLRFQVYPTPNGGTTDLDTVAVLSH